MQKNKGIIYLITNVINGKKYIGQTINPERRWLQHCVNKGQAIDYAIVKYGRENFTYITIEECTVNKLDEREKYWIKKYNTYEGRGYNLSPGGESLRGEENPMYGLKGEKHPAYGYKKRDKEIQRMRKRVSGKNNPMYGKLGKENPFYGEKHDYKTKLKMSGMTKEKAIKIIKTFNNTRLSRKEIANKFGVGRGIVEKIIRGKHLISKQINIKIKKREIKVSKQEGIKIYKEYHDTDITQKDLAEKYKIGDSTVCRIVNCKHSSTRKLNAC